MAPSRRATPEEFFGSADAAFEDACAGAGIVERRFRLAGRSVSLRFAGEALVSPLSRAFDHLREETSGPPELTIGLWDGFSTGTAPPPPVWTRSDYYGNGEIRGYGPGGVRAAFDPEIGMLNLYDRERRKALFWLRDSRSVPISLVGTPLRILLQWWASEAGAQLVHAAAVGTLGGGVLLAGASGAGKSTTALGCLLEGMRFAGDDFVLVAPEPHPFVHGLYGSAKLDRSTLAKRLPALLCHVADREKLPGEKETLFVSSHFPGLMSAGFPLKAILAPRITGERDSRVVPVSSATTLKALLPGVFPLPGARQDAFGRLGALVRSLRSYRLDLGTDLSQIAPLLGELCTAVP